MKPHFSYERSFGIYGPSCGLECGRKIFRFNIGICEANNKLYFSRKWIIC